MAIISSSIILGHINDGYVVYLEHAPQTYTAAWRSLSFLPLFIRKVLSLQVLTSRK